MNPFVHLELHSPDLAASKAFYQSLFDWKLQDTPMGEHTYTVIDMGEQNRGGGMMAKSPEQPTQWLAYIAVASVKETLARAEAAGAKVLVPSTPIPGMGAFGIFLDPAGAPLGVFESSMPPPAPAKQARKPAKKSKPAKKAAPKKAAKKKAATKARRR